MEFDLIVRDQRSDGPETTRLDPSLQAWRILAAEGGISKNIGGRPVPRRSA